MAKPEGDGGNHTITADIQVSRHEAQQPDFERRLDAKLANLRAAVLAVVEKEGWRL